MAAYSFTITEYDPGKPWVVRSTGRSSVELPEGDDFAAWARETYPDRNRWKVELDREPFRWAGLGQ
jgi:hypothetical protein